jgi:AraC-like DNA-binding protein
MQLPDGFLEKRKLESLVENRTSYTLQNAELHIYETHQHASQVFLKFDEPVLASMLEGKKVMHLREQEAFNFLPGESLILPSDEVMCIDFPDADMQNPTRCLAMAISHDKILDIVQEMNENMPRMDEGTWKMSDDNFCFTNDAAIYQIIQRLLFLFAENHDSKDYFVDLMLKELIIRVLQTERNRIYNEQAIQLSSSNRMAYIVKYIREHLDTSLSVEALTRKAYMSESNFHRVFKNELGVSPVTFILNERLKKAHSMLQNPSVRIKRVSAECGFNNMSYFIRVYKKRYGLSPKQHQLSLKERA